MKNINGIKENIIPVFLFLLGFFLLYENIKSFIYSIELYKTFRIHRDFNGCIYAGKQAFPFFEFATSIIGVLFGIILIKRVNILFKVLIAFCLAVIIQYLLNLIFIKVYYLLSNIQIIQDWKLLKIGGILFFTLLLSNHYKYDWKKEIQNLWYFKIIVFTLILLGIKLLLINL